MQTNQVENTAVVLPLPQSIGAELQTGGAKRKVKGKAAPKTVHSVKAGLDLTVVCKAVADALESKRTTAVTAFLTAAKAIKEPANIVDAQKVLLSQLIERRFPSANTRASEFAAVAYAWHHDPAGTDVAVVRECPKMKDGKEVTDQDGKPIMVKPSETMIFKRIRTIRQHIPEGEPGFTKKGNRETKTATKLNATQFARMLDYLKLMDKAQWETFAEKFEAEAAVRTESK